MPIQCILGAIDALWLWIGAACGGTDAAISPTALEREKMPDTDKTERLGLRDSTLILTASGATGFPSISNIGPLNIITGTPNNETLNGTAGDDTITGLGGNDVLIGGDGNDTYVFDTGFDLDRIVETTTGGADAIEFGVGIAAGDIHFFRFGNGNFNAEDLQIRVGADNIQIDDQYDRNTGAISPRVELIRFDDGTEIDLVNDVLTFKGEPTTVNISGTTGDDILIGNGQLPGGQNLRGYAGNDTYIIETDLSGSDAYRFNIFDTTGTDIERVVLTGAASVDDVRFFKVGRGNFNAEDLQIWIDDDLVTLFDQYDPVDGVADTGFRGVGVLGRIGSGPDRWGADLRRSDDDRKHYRYRSV